MLFRIKYRVIESKEQGWKPRCGNLGFHTGDNAQGCTAHGRKQNRTVDVILTA
jgi:hypothetical protein